MEITKIRVTQIYSQIECAKCGKKIRGQSDIAAKHNLKNHKIKCRKKK